MKVIIKFVSAILLLQFVPVTYSATFNYDKNCNVRDKHVFTLTESSTFDLTFLMVVGDPISFQISFKGREKNEDNDLLILESNTGKLQRKRQKIATTPNITLNTTIPVGWNRIDVSVYNSKIEIGNFYTLTGLEYAVLDITVKAKYLTVCTDSTPTWAITNQEEVYFPLSDASSVGLRLLSDQNFYPAIRLYTLDIPLTYNGELTIQKSNVSLPPQDYQMFIEKKEFTISINTKSKSGNIKSLMIVNIEEELVTLKVGTTSGNFILILDPFHENYVDDKTTTITSEYETQQVNQQASGSEDIVHSCTTWKIIAGLASVISLILTCIIACPHILRSMSQTRQVHQMEEGDASIPLINQDPIKDQIKEDPIKDRMKSKHCEPHGEVNTQMGENEKVIYKLKFENGNNHGSKKSLGEFNCNKPKKVILIIGQTGSGKSSFINTMINYVYGVKYDDTFRFKLIDDMDKPNSPETNHTNDIIAYNIPYMTGIKYDFNYIFIDTPGFADTRDAEDDKNWNQKFYDFLHENPDISEIDGICFVAKASDTRMTYIQTYIIDGLFSKFGKDVKNNIYVAVSYSDGSKTHVPDLLKKSGLKYNFAIKFNNNGLYNDKQIESESPKDDKRFFTDNWEMSMKNVHDFFQYLRKSAAVSVSLTSIVLEENKDINKLRDEILELMENENYASDQEKKELGSRIELNQELLMTKLDEAQKLSGRLENIPAKENPLVINEYIDMLIKNEENEDKIVKLRKLKKRNTDFKKLLTENKSVKKLVKSILGDKPKKSE